MREFLAFGWAAIVSMWVAIVGWFAPAPVEEIRIPPTKEFVGPVAPRKLFSPEERECLALNIYFEARNQTPSGQLAVAMVVLNRAEDSFWPANVCDVVKQGSYITGYVARNQCQFSWYCDGLSDRPKEPSTWRYSIELANSAILSWLDGDDVTEGATNYHSDSVSPRWLNDKGMTHIKVIDNHKFYFWQRDEVKIL
jgi:N-acetylmuramoyl-L-alanine amidase